MSTTKTKPNLAQGGSGTPPPKEQNGTVAKRELDWVKPTNKSGLESFVPQVRAQLDRALPRFLAGQSDRLIRCMITETSKNPSLLECTPVSLFGAVIQAGQLGFTIGGPLGEAYLLPFKNGKLSKQFGRDVREVQLCVGYKGYIQLGHRSNAIRRITPVAVRQGDQFVFSRGLENKLEHVPLRNNRNRVTDYYVVIELMNGGKDFEAFTFEDALLWRDTYSTVRSAPDFVKANSPWYQLLQDGSSTHGFDAMALKTLIRQLGKRMPLSVEWNMAVNLDDMAEHGIEQNLGTVMMTDAEAPAAPEPPEKELAGRLEQAKNGSAPKGQAGDPDADPFETGEAQGSGNMFDGGDPRDNQK